MKTEFPKDDFGVIVENGNGKEIIDFLVECGFEKNGLFGGLHNGLKYTVVNNDNVISCNESVSKTFTLTELKTLKQNCMKEKEIIGYLAPYDLFDGKVKKGTIYEFDLAIKGSNNPYAPKEKDNSIHWSATRLPKEIVETWEPVYKEEKQLPKINGYDGKVVKKIDGEYIQYGCAEFHKRFFELLYGLHKEHAQYTNNFKGNTKVVKSIKLESGVEITMDQIKQIVEYFTTN